jgi:hypothetical protein
MDPFWSGPARQEFVEGGEGLGPYFACPPGSISAQNNDGHPSWINGGKRSSEQQNRRIGRTPKTLAHFIPFPNSSTKPRQREREMTVGGQPARGAAPPASRSLACDVHPKVSAPPSSRLAAVPQGGDRSRDANDPTSGGGRAAWGPSRSTSSSTTTDPDMEVR